MKLTIKCDCGNEIEIDSDEFKKSDVIKRNDFFVFKDYESLQISCNKCNEVVFI